MKLIPLLMCMLFVYSNNNAQPVQQHIAVLANKPTAVVQPTMWGIFFEDINFGADGGLYAELIKNRSFEFAAPLMGWKELNQHGSGHILIVNHGAENSANPRFARIKIERDVYGISNEGFRGIGIQKGATYNFSMMARTASGNISQINLNLVNANGEKIGGAEIKGFTNEWKKYTVSFTATASALKATFEVLVAGKGEIDVDMISLFPEDTWKGRKNGMRKDLVQMLADLKPGFIRFPGGCIVEGRDLANRYQWKNTVGNLDERKLIINRWNVEFASASAPDYFQTFGLGFFEYFQLAEDVGAEPLPILNCGMACQYNSGEVVSMDELDPYIQDALDLIEFANGDVTTKWGNLRSSMGHPSPFNLKFLGIGNEQWDEQYIERYKQFRKIIKARYPEIKLIAAAGPSPDGKRFEYAWKEFKTPAAAADIVDEHYYQKPSWFLKNVTRYDAYDRNGPKIFAGEYAVHDKEGKEPESKNTLWSAITEAALMTGLERNADIVHMASYAPLFAHVEAWQWRPDLIWFDNLNVVGTPNYYAQKMFSVSKGTDVIPAQIANKPVTGYDSLYASATKDKNTKMLYAKVVNVSSTKKNVTIDVDATIGKEYASEVLTANTKYAFNSIGSPEVVKPIRKSGKCNGHKILLEILPWSFTVVSVPLK